jgi:hypothetical protein
LYLQRTERNYLCRLVRVAVFAAVALFAPNGEQSGTPWVLVMPINTGFSVAGELGFEPRLTESESNCLSIFFLLHALICKEKYRFVRCSSFRLCRDTCAGSDGRVKVPNIQKRVDLLRYNRR